MRRLRRTFSNAAGTERYRSESTSLPTTEVPSVN
jgi:hypothetical protein